jgi:hypothetical protein
MVNLEAQNGADFALVNKIIADIMSQCENPRRSAVPILGHTNDFTHFCR